MWYRFWRCKTTAPALRRVLFLALIAVSAMPWCGPATALAAGVLFSLVAGNPWPQESAVWSKRLLQLSVVGLGFGVGIIDVWRAGSDAILYTPAGIGATVVAGLLLGRLLDVPPRTSGLISFGTAICGGSAIAAMAPVIGADNDEMAVSLATVFSLNAAALLLFPAVGRFFGLNEHQFGLWAALAVHDTSSVVGAASAFGATALAVGTTVKLARAIWIAPAALIVSRFTHTRARAPFPLFILGFVAAATLRSVLPSLAELWGQLAAVARQGLVVTLFLVGNGLSREVLCRVGLRPLFQGMLLWISVSAAMLALIMKGWIR
jgi:uncharacterized integral membrane protein (TIGR00698 family)